jgi:hypothetical protein
MPMGPKTLFALGALAEAAFWAWLFMNALHGHYPVTFIGWISLVVDPLVFIIILIPLFSDRKYRSKDL